MDQFAFAVKSVNVRVAVNTLASMGKFEQNSNYTQSAAVLSAGLGLYVPYLPYLLCMSHRLPTWPLIERPTAGASGLVSHAGDSIRQRLVRMETSCCRQVSCSDVLATPFASAPRVEVSARTRSLRSAIDVGKLGASQVPPKG